MVSRPNPVGIQCYGRQMLRVTVLHGCIRAVGLASDRSSMIRAMRLQRPSDTNRIAVLVRGADAETTGQTRRSRSGKASSTGVSSVLRFKSQERRFG